MKKIICLILVLIFVLTALTGCIKKDEENGSLSSTMSNIESKIDEASSIFESSSKTESITSNQ